MDTEELCPKVSIVIPVYNGSNFLKQAIDSALVQTYKNIEIIVVNDGSNDNGATEKVAKSYGDKIRYYKKENGGVASALNYGIKKMLGDYFSWLSHDDMYEKTKVDDQVDLLNSLNDENIIIASNVRVLFENGVKKKESIDKKTFDFFDIFLATSANVGLNGCSLLIPKKALSDSGGFDVNLPVTQDYDLWFRLKNKYKFVLLEKPLVISRRHEMQDSVQKHMLMIKAGDKLHYEFLSVIAYEGFEKYFSKDKANIKHFWGNYILYRKRRYLKTASMMLKSILRYYYENDSERFYKIFNSEIGIATKLNGKLTSANHHEIDLEYNKIVNSESKNFLIKTSQSRDETPHTNSRISRFARLFSTSIKQDGVYLTGEKIVRKVNAKLTKKKR